MQFETDLTYTDRETKASYVWRKYREILQGRILDVGADQCFLREYLTEGVEYWGVGLGEGTDQQLDLEKEGLPFLENTYDTVLCLDVLEHLDNIHELFDDLCRVSKRYVIVSLPNAYAHFYNMMLNGDYRPGRALKFYGLPLDKPEDRHKWFFSDDEARAFLRHRAAENGMRLLQMDNEPAGGEGRGIRGLLRRFARRLLLHVDFNERNLVAGTLWAVLEKADND